MLFKGIGVPKALRLPALIPPFFLGGQPSYPTDVYKMSVKMRMLMAEVTMLPNARQGSKPRDSYDTSKPKFSIRLPKNSGGTDGTEGLVRGGNKAQQDHRPTAGATETAKFIYAKVGPQKIAQLCLPLTTGVALQCWDPQKQEYICNSRERHVLRSPKVKVVYAQDEGGIMMDDKYDRNGSPEFSLHLDVQDTIINYGAWANYQRALQQYRFFPEDWKLFDEKVFVPARGLQRVAGHLNVVARLSLAKVLPYSVLLGERGFDGALITHCLVLLPQRPYTSFRIPYRRELYPSEVQVGETRKHMLEWLELQSEGPIDIIYRLPWVTLPSDNGVAHQIRATLPRVTAVSSFNRAPLLTTNSLVVSGHLFNDSQWRSPALWDFDLSFTNPEIWMLYDHVNLFTDLTRSWTGFSLDPQV